MLAEYTKDGHSLIAAAKLLLHEFFHGIRLKDRPEITAPWMLLEEQMMPDDSEWRNGQMPRQVSDRKAVIYNILNAIPMEPRKPGDPIVAPSDADQELAIAEVISRPKPATRPSRRPSSRAASRAASKATEQARPARPASSHWKACGVSRSASLLHLRRKL